MWWEIGENTWGTPLLFKQESKPPQSKAEQYPGGTTMIQLHSNWNSFSYQMGHIVSIFLSLDELESH